MFFFCTLNLMMRVSAVEGPDDIVARQHLLRSGRTFRNVIGRTFRSVQETRAPSEQCFARILGLDRSFFHKARREGIANCEQFARTKSTTRRNAGKSLCSILTYATVTRCCAKACHGFPKALRKRAPWKLAPVAGSATKPQQLPRGGRAIKNFSSGCAAAEKDFGPCSKRCPCKKGWECKDRFDLDLSRGTSEMSQRTSEEYGVCKPADEMRRTR